MRRALAPTQRVHENLRDKEADSDANRDLDHPNAKLEAARVSFHGSRVVLDEAATAADSGLDNDRWCGSRVETSIVSHSSTLGFESKAQGRNQALTGTRNRTPVTMDVNAVPPMTRE